MKKNISINISGIIFHIEEDGYDRFKKYLDSINKYFASYEDSEEIIADIESRIAELFLEKLDDGKQVISNDDVNALISTMGQISDFEAMEEEADFAQASNDKTNAKAESKKKTSDKKKAQRPEDGPRKFERDTSNQLIGGVAAGLAHYFNIDSIWVRVLFIILFPTSLSLFVYVILWVVIPGNDNLVINENVKKLYRDPDDRVLGGVASGLANYFRTDAIVFRIIFILLTFGGVGVLAYIILWIIAPKANSLTDKMQMKGQKVTLSNIDSNIKKTKEESLNPKGENTFTTVLLFPFRLVGRVFSALGKALAPLMLFIVAAIRIFTGGIVLIVGLSVMFSLLVTAGVLMGLYNGDWFFHGDDFTYFPYEVFTNTFPELGVLFVLTAIFIPFLYVFIAGITIIAKRRVMSSSVGWSILGIWMIAVVGSFALVPNVIRDFRDEGYYEESEVLNIEADTLLLDINVITNRGFDSRRYRTNTQYEWESEFTDLDLIASRDGEFSIKKRFHARGRNPRDAEMNAQDVSYEYTVEGSKITFDSELTFNDRAEFRFQEADVTLYIPKNVPFKLERDMSLVLHHFSYRYSWFQIYRNTWMFDDNGRLNCLTCEETGSRARSNANSNNYSRSLNVEDFSTIEIWDNMDVTFTLDEKYSVSIEGPQSKIDRVLGSVTSDKLVIDEDGSGGNWSNVKIYISAPAVDRITLKNGAKLTMEAKDMDFLEVRTDEDSRFSIDGSIDKLDLKIMGNSRVDMSATVDKLEALVVKKARLYAYEAIVREADIETGSEARVRVNVSDYLKIQALGFSSIRYKGNPEVDIVEEGNSATISKY
ncbi:PspC domain-containing protein [Roseivirga sp. E12]|uniref:PspC domain-containing protein n=1 Tax=Roseivirga sp. E12 TaxID=2819237 RepID=UPI001ABC7AA8|nr:PspC domain-containing protein [Roseivirga sp. E12]MBO3700209.1 PspC domain-containing protein [Roseivirga sp. E12]